MAKVPSMDFDRFTIGLLILREDAPKLSEQEENALQDAHMAHLAKLHDEGLLLDAGPLFGSSDHDLRGLAIYRGTPEQVRQVADQDPGVRAGRYTHRVLLSKESNVCSARVFLDEPPEGYASSSRFLDLDKCSWREFEGGYGQLFFRLA